MATLVFQAEACAQQPARVVGHAPQPGFAGLAPFAFGFAFRALGIAGLAFALFGGLLAFGQGTLHALLLRRVGLALRLRIAAGRRLRIGPGLL